MPSSENGGKQASKRVKRPRHDHRRRTADPATHSTGESLTATDVPWLQSVVDHQRVRCLTPTITDPNPEGEIVVCLLQRDMRLQDNWALLFAQDAAISLRTPLYVMHLVVPRHTFQPTLRHLAFHLKGVEELAKGLADNSIAFRCIPISATDDDASMEEAHACIEAAVAKLKPSIVVCDFMPLRRPAELANHVADVCVKKGFCPLYQVDAHNIVPAWVASNKQEYAARTIRPRLLGLLKAFAGEIPCVQQHPHKCLHDEIETCKASEIIGKIKFDDLVSLPSQWVPGAKAGLAALKHFCTMPRFNAYASRNNPMIFGQSGLSPWLHFGQLSAQRCLLSVNALGRGTEIGAIAAAARDSFTEELVVRRELAENFTFYNTMYDEIEGAPKWAQDTIAAHRHDERQHVYSVSELEASKTLDALWNAAQLQLVHDGKMHGFLRMYWAKKILEWTPSAKSALQISLHLNDKYSLDGTDPNGVVGCMWSIAGVHDQAWAERPVFGKIRYMNLAGCKRKFHVDDFVRRFPGAARIRAMVESKEGLANNE